jgi:DNA-directed RNA polymerase specialized sigma subunit
MEFREFMESIQQKVSERDYLIILKRLDGYTFEEIGDFVGISKQGVEKTFKKKLLPKLRAYV